MKTSSKILFLIYFICVTPVVIIYFMHGHHELIESDKLEQMGNPTKATKTLAEGAFLIFSAVGYIAASIVIIIAPHNPIAYGVVIIGTIIIIAIFLGRSEYGIPIPTTGLEITKYTVGWEGFWTKVLQTILIAPVAILLDRSERKGESGL